MIKHERSQDLIDFADRFAESSHRDQVRKFTLESYIDHPRAVAKLVSEITNDCEMICAALLHDTIEDCGVTKQDLIDVGFGFTIADLVQQLSNVRSGKNRRERKRDGRLRLQQCDYRVQTIKICDITHNAETMHLDPTGFALTWYIESYALALVLTKADIEARKRCLDLLEYHIDKLMKVKI